MTDMRIEINAGGIGGISVSDYQTHMQSFVSDADSVIASFKVVKSNTYNLNGGVGNLQRALDSISARVQQEEAKRTAVTQVQSKANDFLRLAARVDNWVAASVEQNKEEFYRTKWLKPMFSIDETAWYEDAWNWLCGAKDAIVEGTKAIRTGIKNTIKKAWDGLVVFYNKYKIIIDTSLIVVGAIAAIVVVVATGGWALVPLLINVFGIQASTAIAISTAIAVATVVTTVASSTLNIVDVWAEIDHPLFDTFQSALNISNSLLNITYSAGNIYNAIKGFRIARFDGNKIIQNNRSFDLAQVDSAGRTNIERMNRGMAPIGKDGKAVELHHLLQTEDGGLIELTQTAHRGKGTYAFWHNTDSSFTSVVDHGKSWTNFTKSYWKWRNNTSYKLPDFITKFSTLINIGTSGSALLDSF